MGSEFVSEEFWSRKIENASFPLAPTLFLWEREKLGRVSS